MDSIVLYVVEAGLGIVACTELGGGRYDAIQEAFKSQVVERRLKFLHYPQMGRE